MLALALALGCGAAPPRATRLDESGVDAALRLHAPDACGEADALAHRVEARIHRDAFVDDGLSDRTAEVVIEVTVTWTPGGPDVTVQRTNASDDDTNDDAAGAPDRGGGAADASPETGPASSPGVWRAEIVTRAWPGGQELGRRNLEEPGDDCEALAPSLAFVIGLVVDAPALREALRALPPPPPPSRDPAFEVGAQGGAALGRTPEWSGITGLYASLALPEGVVFRLDVAVFLPGLLEVSPHRLSTWGGDAGISVCPRIEALPFRLDLCGGAHVGFVAAEGEGFDRNESSLAGTFDLALFAHPALQLDPIVVGLDVGFGVALLRPDFVFYDGAGVTSLYAPSLLFGRLTASVGLRFD